MREPQIALVGFMASGKSTLGPRLAGKLRRPFLDLDEQVEQAAGRSIAEIFAEDGEAEFRERESRALREQLAGPLCVLATGGGVIERAENRSLLRERCLVVWLDPPFEAIRRRLLASATRRPLLERLGMQGLRELLERRRPLYAAAADLRVSAHAMPVARLAREIARDLRAQLGETGP